MADSTYWTYRGATPTPTYAEAIHLGAFRGTEGEWLALSPGMRREVCRQVRQT